jgi:hypothetical protein
VGQRYNQSVALTLILSQRDRFDKYPFDFLSTPGYNQCIENNDWPVQKQVSEDPVLEVIL